MSKVDDILLILDSKWQHKIETAKQQLLAEVLELAPEVDERLFRENAQYYFGKKEAIQEYQSNLRKGIA